MSEILTIEKSVDSLLKVKGSKFICYAIPINSLDEWAEAFAKIKSDHAKASHHCYGYIVEGKSRCSDDGEPSGTAGKPIMGQIMKDGLSEIGVVVVRYFGGTLLGTGGLIRAYRDSVRQTLDLASYREIVLYTDLSLTCTYEIYPEVMRLVKRYHIRIKDQILSERPYLLLSIEQNDYEEIFSTIKQTLLPSPSINYNQDRFLTLVEFGEELE